MNHQRNKENVNNYDGIVFQGNIKLHSFCSHHHLPFMVTSISLYLMINGMVIGLNKLNRIVEFY